jgi:hypothetical protein
MWNTVTGSPKPFGGAIVDSEIQVKSINDQLYGGKHVFGLSHGLFGTFNHSFTTE